MYAKLVMSSAPTNYNDFCRDIIRLVTSNSPSTSLLSSSTWSVGACIIFDNTPAGWEYVGSNAAGEDSALGAVNSNDATPSSGVSSALRWVVRSACASPMSSRYKYVSMISQQQTIYNTWAVGTQSKVNACLSACTNSTSSGTLTNEAYRLGSNSGVSYYNASGFVVNDWGFAGTGTYHLIANPRHITLIKENSNIQALWEHSVTDPHVFYNIAPMVFYSWSFATSGSAVGSWATSTGAVDAASGAYNGAWVMNLTDTATGTNYGSRPVNVSGSDDYFSNGANQPYFWPHLTKVTTSSATGLSRHLVSPIMFNLFHHGYPTMYVTGTVPAYLMKGGVGTTGDSININGTLYTYFNVNSAMGLAMLTN